MKSLFVAAGLFVAVGLIAAAPASADGSSVACAPAFLCRIAGAPGQAAENIVTAPGRAYQNITGYPERAHQNITGYPGRASPEHHGVSGARAPKHHGVSGARVPEHHGVSATRDRQHPRAIRTCSRSGVTAVGWRSVVIVATRSLGFGALIRDAIPAPLWSIRRRGGAWDRPLSGEYRPHCGGVRPASQLGDVRFPRPSRHLLIGTVGIVGHRRQQDLVGLELGRRGLDACCSAMRLLVVQPRISANSVITLATMTTPMERASLSPRPQRRPENPPPWQSCAASS